MALLFCSALLINSKAQAQCPDSTWSTYTISEFLPGTTCYVLVDFCWKWDSDGVYHVLFDDVSTSGPDSGCFFLTPQEMILGAITAFEANPYFPPGSGGVIVPCGSGGGGVGGGGETTLIRYSVQECWQLNAQGAPVECPGMGIGIIGKSCFTGGGCTTVCDYCKEPDGTIVELSCTSTNTYSGACSIAPPNGPWVPCECYDIKPCGD
jgi:hypothetical protein